MSLMFQPLRKYADFNGRACRTEYWLFTLLQLGYILGGAIVTCLIALIAGLLTGGAHDSTSPADGILAVILFVFLGIWGLGALAMVIPSFAVTIRRLHDSNRPAAFILFGLLPVAGALVLLIFTLIEGTRGPNMYGPDPKFETY